MKHLNQPEKPTPSHSTWTTWLTGLGVLLIFGLGMGVRLFDITDEPLDFHPTRQLRGAIIARGIYYQMRSDIDDDTRHLAQSFANSTGQYEPSILENIAAVLYLLTGGEHIWIGQIVNTVFWLLGGLAIFGLARRVSSSGPAILVTGYYLLLPFGVQASRTLQPDPGMVMWIALSLYALYRWSERPTWKWTLLAGVLGGMAVLSKIVAAFLVGSAAIALVLYTLGIKRFWRSLQVWTMMVIMVTPTALYYLVRSDRASEYLSSWTLALSHLLLDPTVYARWFRLVESLMGLVVIFLALLGVLISRSRYRSMLVGLWIGYLLYGLWLPYQMYTHNYYHLQLIPVISLSLVPVGETLLDRLHQQTRLWQVLSAGIAVAALVYPAWLAITPQREANYRHEPVYWAQIGSLLPADGKILALTQDYGYRLMYYGWRKVILWPTRGEQQLSKLRGDEKEFDAFFEKRIEGMSYFLITAFNQFEDQPTLAETLYARYPIYAEGSGYLIFDLEHPLPR